MRKRVVIAAGFAALVCVMAHAQTTPAAHEIRRFTAEEANQGVASDANFFYAIDDHAIGKYSKATGKRVAHWQGEPPTFIHINSATQAFGLG
jgi:hypothetical protein